MADAPLPSRRATDTVELACVEQLLGDPPALERLFTERELRETGVEAKHLNALAARLAAKNACGKLVQRDVELDRVTLRDFEIVTRADGLQLELNPAARAALDRHRLEAVRLSIAPNNFSVSAVAEAAPRQTDVPWFGKFLYHALPYRRGLALENLRRVFGDTLPETEIRRLAQAYYAHYARFISEFARSPFLSAERRRRYIRVENIESPIRAHERGKGVLLLTGHFGNWEIATSVGIKEFPQYKNLFHFVRRPIKPQFLNDLIAWRDRRTGFGTLSKRGSLDTMLDLLSHGAIIIFVFDQHAGRKDGVVVDFFNHPAGTFKSVALLAMTTGAPVIPASSWREPDGSHVMRFEDPLPLIECDDTTEAIRRNTQAYNVSIERMLLRHPEQWIWMHQRWKVR